MIILGGLSKGPPNPPKLPRAAEGAQALVMSLLEGDLGGLGTSGAISGATAGVGRFGDGRIAELFMNTAKHGTSLDVNARDAAVAASLLLQHGCPVETLRRALTSNGDGSASGPRCSKTPRC